MVLASFKFDAFSSLLPYEETEISLFNNSISCALSYYYSQRCFSVRKYFISNRLVPSKYAPPSISTLLAIIFGLFNSLLQLCLKCSYFNGFRSFLSAQLSSSYLWNLTYAGIYELASFSSCSRFGYYSLSLTVSVSVILILSASVLYDRLYSLPSPSFSLYNEALLRYCIILLCSALFSGCCTFI